MWGRRAAPSREKPEPMLEERWERPDSAAPAARWAQPGAYCRRVEDD